MMIGEQLSPQELPEKPGIGDVVELPYLGGYRRNVVVDNMPEHRELFGASLIMDEGTPEERLAFAGTMPLVDSETRETYFRKTGDGWDTLRILRGFARTLRLNPDDPDDLEKVRIQLGL